MQKLNRGSVKSKDLVVSQDLTVGKDNVKATALANPVTMTLQIFSLIYKIKFRL